MSRILNALTRRVVPPVVATAVVLPVSYATAKLASLASNHFLANDPGNGITITTEKIEAMAVFFPLLLLALAVVFVGGPALANRSREIQLRRAN